jgi:hypothetical protein
MRPYRFKIRLSSKRLNVTRAGKGLATALRAAARLSLGSASSDIEPIERLLSYWVHDRADCLPPQGGFRQPGRDYCATDCPMDPARQKMQRHEIVS